MPALSESATRRRRERRQRPFNAPSLHTEGWAYPPTTPSKAVSANENLVTPLPMMVSWPSKDAIVAAVAFI